MTATRVLVHCGLTRLSVGSTLVHAVLDLSDGLDDDHVEVLDEDALLWVFLEVKLLLGVLSEQVTNLFIVNLQVAAADEELLLCVLCVIKVAEDVVERVRDDTALRLVSLQTNHGMRLTATSLSIGENSALVASHN